MGHCMVAFKYRCHSRILHMLRNAQQSASFCLNLPGMLDPDGLCAYREGRNPQHAITPAYQRGALPGKRNCVHRNQRGKGTAKEMLQAPTTQPQKVYAGLCVPKF